MALTFVVSLSVCLAVFVGSVLAKPLLPSLSDHSRRPSVALLSRILDPRARESAFLFNRERERLIDSMSPSKRGRGSVPADEDSPIVAAFYAPWQETGIHSLRQNAANLTHLMPEWLHLDGDGESLDFTDWNPDASPLNLEVVKIARENGVAIVPILNNAEQGEFDPDRATKLLSSPQRQLRLANAVADWLQQNGFQGVNLDLENLHNGDYKRLPGFVALLRSVLAPKGLIVSVDVEADKPMLPLKQVAAASDFVVWMAYDEHAQSDAPGPIADVDWVADGILRARRSVPANKLVLGIGNYAYDWTEGRQAAESISYQQALTLAKGYRDEDKPEDVIELDPDSLNNTFDYADDDDAVHHVWMLDGVSAYNQLKLARRANLRGSALWLLGMEDPTIWHAMDRRKTGLSSVDKQMRGVHFPYEVEFQGRGEILRVRNAPRDGERTFDVDLRTGLCVGSVYHSYPSSYLVQRTGYEPKKLCLTFDDGPSSNYTPQILDALKELRAPATFFVIGQNAERNPDLLRRIVAEGHEVGNHTFTHPNMGAVNDKRARLEINTTQRLLQSVLGRSSLLFRPPYNADAEPTSPDEVKAIGVASSLGYLYVGEFIDPQDWNTKGRTAADIARSVEEQVRLGQGNVILLHDGGGDRSATVAALRRIVPELRAKGYDFVSLASLAHMTPEQVMPPVSDKDRLLIGIDAALFWLAFVVDAFLAVAFVAAIALGLGRVALIVPLAVAHNRRRNRTGFDPAFRPSVSVLVAAYNEEKVVVQTVRTILASDYEVAEVVVVDDGSKDGTYLAVESAFSGDDRVTLLTQPNAGKAAALNHAIEVSKGEVLVCIDADTQIRPDAIGKLVRSFRDPEVGAVAGNIKVGNRVNLLTHWQSIEYITSQNMDRRAYALLNAVTVVPGALGAWRRQAIVAAGGYTQDTLAEDMDLTWRLRRAGWRIETDSDAIALTEAPDNLRGFFKQRFRWAYGTLQCLWKHRGALAHHGWFGWFALPTLWVFQIAFQALAPLVDLQLLFAATGFAKAWVTRGVYFRDWQPLAAATASLQMILGLYLLFFAVELTAAAFAYRMDREDPRGLWRLFLQRFVYRQVMYGVMYKSMVTAIQGLTHDWGKVERKATVTLD